MYKVLLSIGTNTHARFNLSRAKILLQSCFPTIQFTEIAESKPYGQICKNWFLNTLGYFETELSKGELVKQFKDIEKTMGRSLEHNAEGKVIIDIDLIKWDKEIVKPEDFKRSYIRDLLQFVNN